MRTRTPVRHAALLAGGLAASLLATRAALAGNMSVNYAFNSLVANGDTTCTTGNCKLGSNTETYTSNGISLTALSFAISDVGAWQTNTAVSQRFGAAGGAEVGLGVASGRDSAGNGSSLEIASNEWLVLDVSNLINAGYHSFSLGIGSIQSGEGGQVDVFTSGNGFSGTAGGYYFSPKNLSLLGSATSNTNGGAALQNIALTGINQNYLVITAYNPSARAGNILVTDLSATQPATQTPEPGSLALLAAGLAAVGLALGARRRQRG